MRHLASILSLCCFLVLSISGWAHDSAVVNGKWNGKFRLSAGSNFEKAPGYKYIFTHSQGEGFAQVGYTASKFAVLAKVDASSSVHYTLGSGATLSPVGDSAIKADVDFTFKQSRVWKVNAGVEADYKPAPSDPLHFYYTYKILSDCPDKAVLGVNDILSDSSSMLLGINSEDVDIRRQTHLAGLSHQHQFSRPGRALKTKVDMDLTSIEHNTRWDVVNGKLYSDKGYKDKTYRVTPSYFDDEVKASLGFQERNMADVAGLDLDATVFFRFKGDKDELRAANYIDSVWVDSASFREDFLFHSYEPAPQLRLAYTRGIYHIEVAYMPQFYLYDLSGDGKKGNVMMGNVEHFVDFNAYVTPWKYHRFALLFKRTVQRPDYLQICWFDRPGQYAREIIRGNPSLVASARDKVAFQYDFSYKGFTAKLETGFTYDKNKIERTYTTEVINSEKYRVYTWVNADEGYTTNLKLDLLWAGKYVRVGAGGVYNYFYGTKLSGSATRNSDYGVNGLAAFEMKGWLLEAKVNYQSKIIRTYITTTEIVGLNARFGKKFTPFGKDGKGGQLAIYIEGRDLLDKTIETYTISADETQVRCESLQLNRRLFLLNLQYQF